MTRNREITVETFTAKITEIKVRGARGVGVLVRLVKEDGEQVEVIKTMRQYDCRSVYYWHRDMDRLRKQLNVEDLTEFFHTEKFYGKSLTVCKKEFYSDKYDKLMSWYTWE